MTCLSICSGVCDFCKPTLTKIVDSAYDLCITQVSYVCSLATNLEKLERASSDLKQSRDSMMDLVDTAEQNGGQRTSSVEEWFKKVANQRAKAKTLLEEGGQQSDKLSCTVNVCPIYKVGVKIVSMIKSLTDLKEEGDKYTERDVATGNGWFPRGNCSRHAEGYSYSEYETVGNLEAHKKEVLEYLEGPEEWIVRVLGGGGIGKTTLLGLIIKHFIAIGDSNLVIYVQVKDLGVDDIQRAIIEKMGFLNDWRYESVEQRASYIYEVLQKKQIRQCVLLLDDIRNSSIRIEDIVGKHQNHLFKVVFTTRRSMVENEIAAKRTVIVKPLKEEHGRKLFENAAGINMFLTNTRIKNKVRELIDLCGGLPSALIKLGEALVGRNYQEWEDTISFFKNPEQQNDMTKLLEEMKYSYEFLDVNRQECFLYSCMFLPRDSYIPSYELEDLLIYGDCSIHFIGDTNARRTSARKIIRDLSNEMLLELADSEVNLHNVVRCMGLWLAKDRMMSMKSIRENLPEDQKKRVLLMTNELPNNDMLPKDARRNLRTWFVTIDEAPSPSKMFHYDQLFKGMNALVVLKLSGSDVKELPKSISGLRS